MKKQASKFKFLLLFTGAVFAFMVHGQAYEKSRKVTKSFPVTSQTEIQVSNKYGNIHLIPWEEDSVKFEISLLVKANKESKVNKTFEYIDFDFKATEYYVIVQTVFQGKGGFWTEVSDLASNLFSSGTTTQIDYTIHFPVKNEMQIDNKFGNIYTTDHTSKIEITLSNGDLKAHAFKGDTKINLEFGTADIDEFERGTIVLKYAELNLEKSDFLNVESRSSKLYITETEDIKINSRRDRMNLRVLNSIEGEASFTYLKIRELINKMELKTKYGELELDMLTEEADFITIESEYTDITLPIDPERFYDVEVIHNGKTEMILPQSVLTRKESLVSEEDDIEKLEFKAGTLSTKEIPISIKAGAGKINFKED
jgi:hypothetical protein